MINVKVIRASNEIKKINVLGHANYDSFGKDIVCSGVSSIVTTTVNAILTFDKNYITYNAKQDNFEIVVKENNQIVDNLLNNMIIMLSDLAKDYPKNVKIKEEQV